MVTEEALRWVACGGWRTDQEKEQELRASVVVAWWWKRQMRRVSVEHSELAASVGGKQAVNLQVLESLVVEFVFVFLL